MKETVDLPEHTTDQLHRLRARLRELQGPATGDTELAAQVERLTALLDHLEQSAADRDDDGIVLEEQQLLAEARLARLRRHLDELDARLAIEASAEQAMSGPESADADGPRVVTEPARLSPHPGSAVPVVPARRSAAQAKVGGTGAQRQESRPLSIVVSLVFLAGLATLTLFLTPIP